jgi:eukaryotic-like serine/threonine-protein kinase
MNDDRWQKVQTLLSGALAQPADARGPFLDEACAGDPGLRHEVESLLEWEEKEPEFLERPAAEAHASLAGGPEASDLSGNSVGHYQVLSKLGEGGMGVVYRARDSRLDRHVALKLLPDEFAHDAARLARFEREAKLLASLSHPNIATLHGLEETDGRKFIVMELVEGRTLAHRLRKGPLPVDEALDVCRQIAEGLEAAHEKGVIHRDLKPGNVMITRDGKAKILDFGLARGANHDGPAEDPSRSTTGAGVILGTAAYMSPEQATGKPVDKRTDIWSFGCILYECLTGVQPFQARTLPETNANVLGGPPDWGRLPDRTPATIRLLLRWCLQKDPAHRLHDASDARIAIVESAVLQETALAEKLARRGAWRRAIPWALGVVVLATASIAVWRLRVPSPTPPATKRLAIPLPQEHWWKSGIWGPWISLSRDGSTLVYAVRHGDSSYLCLRRINEYESRRIQGSEGAAGGFFSPDGRWVGFSAGGRVWRVPAAGGTPQLVAESEGSTGGAWSGVNEIIVSQMRYFYRIPATGGAAERLPVKLYENERGQLYFRHIQLLPGEKSALFTVKRGVRSMQVAAFSLETGEARVIVDRGCSPRYLASGHLVYAWESELLAAPFDLKTLRLTGTPVPVLQGVLTDTMGLASYSVSDDGTLAYVPGGVAGRSLPVWVNRKGEEEPLPHFQARHYSYPRLSRDGKLFIRWGEEGQKLRVHDLQRGTEQVLSRQEGDDMVPVSHPNGEYVVFSASRNGSARNLWKKYLDGSEREERLTESRQDQYPQDISPDGGLLAFVEGRPAATGGQAFRDIFLLPLDGGGAPRPLFADAPDNLRFLPTFSPDGHWIAYVSFYGAGRGQVFITDSPGASKKYQMSTTGGWAPVWAPDGREIFYWSSYWGPDFLSVPFASGSPLRPEKPSLLFSRDDMWGAYSTGRGYDISPDGRRFLMLKRIMPEFRQINVVQNWFTELNRLCPTGK